MAWLLAAMLLDDDDYDSNPYSDKHGVQTLLSRKEKQAINSLNLGSIVNRVPKACIYEFGHLVAVATNAHTPEEISTAVNRFRHCVNLSKN